MVSFHIFDSYFLVVRFRSTTFLSGEVSKQIGSRLHRNREVSEQRCLDLRCQSAMLGSDGEEWSRDYARSFVDAGVHQNMLGLLACLGACDAAHIFVLLTPGV